MIYWIRKKIGMPALAGKLENFVVKGEVPYPAVYALFDASGIYSREELLEIRESIRVLENQTVIEKKKQRADYLMMHEQNREALYLYLMLLEDHNLYKMPKSLNAEICYHAGIIYTRYFLYREALQQFEAAWRIFPSEAFRTAYLKVRCLLILHDADTDLPQTDIEWEEEEAEEVRKEILDRLAAIREKEKRKKEKSSGEVSEEAAASASQTDRIQLFHQSEQWLEEYEKSLR
jgi:hypothetical protein